VDAEQEFMLALENQMMYTLLSQSAAFEFGQIASVLR
jgi:flagellar basal-body rod protein FlgB